MGAGTDWISAICSLVAALVALVTLFTVFVAAEQVISRRQIYRLGLSVNSLGPWKDTVLARSFFARFQLHIRTPTINVATLVSKKWQPEFSIPEGFTLCPDDPQKAVTISELKETKRRQFENLRSNTIAKVLTINTAAELEKCLNSDPEHIFADSSWVNFLQALGLSPEPSNPKFYKLQFQSELVNGIVPMRWKGKDLVSICSILGFQASEKEPDYKMPMPLPLQWNCMLGWIQFRESPEGCIAEYRIRTPFSNNLTEEIHEFYKKKSTRPINLKFRLWYSVSALALPEEDKEAVFLGGSDRCQRPWDCETEDLKSPEKIFESLMETEYTNQDQIKHALWGPRANHPDALRSSYNAGQLCQDGKRDLSAEIKKKQLEKKVRVMRECHGLLSVVVEGERIFARGLSPEKCHEWSSTYVDDDAFNKDTHPYNLGRIYIDKGLLLIMKKAVLYMLPDSYYFTSTIEAKSSCLEIWRHVQEFSDRNEYFMPRENLKQWYDDNTRKSEDNTRKSENNTRKSEDNTNLYKAMVLCNELQTIRKKQRASYTINDIKVISKASLSLRKILKLKEAEDIVWALVAQPKLFNDILERFRKGSLKTTLSGSIEITRAKDDLFASVECTAIKCPKVDDDHTFSGKYLVPCVKNGVFQADCVLAASLDVFLTYMWIEAGWVSDVTAYDSTIPQTVTMC